MSKRAKRIITMAALLVWGGALMPPTVANELEVFVRVQVMEFCTIQVRTISLCIIVHSVNILYFPWLDN